MTRIRSAATAVGAAACLALLTACGAGEEVPAPVETVFVTVTPSCDACLDDPATGSAESGDVNGASGEATTTEELPEPSTVITDAVTTPRRLTLAEVFEVGEWREGPIDIPNSDEPVQAIYYRDLSCSPRQIELRFRNQQGALAVEVGQALDSVNSDVTVEYRLYVDGRLVESQKVLFNERRRLNADLTGVSAVILQAEAERGESSRSCQTTAVLTALEVVPPGL